MARTASFSDTKLNILFPRGPNHVYFRAQISRYIHLEGNAQITGSAFDEVFYRANESLSDQMSHGLGFAQDARIISILDGTLAVTANPEGERLLPSPFPHENMTLP